jgi:hypothetical protein
MESRLGDGVSDDFFIFGILLRLSIIQGGFQ